jgi:DNA polymerase eta
MDCYYAQCEHKRLNIDENIPLAVRQWNGIVAVNYAARARGVKMSMNIVSTLLCLII